MTTIDTVSSVYDAVSTTVATGQTDRDMKANNPTLFKNLTTASFCRITTDAQITIKFNSTSMPWIVMTSSESPRKFTRAEEWLAITNIFVSNASGWSAAIKIELYS